MKDGREIFVRPYQKGPERENLNAIKPKQYVFDDAKIKEELSRLGKLRSQLARKEEFKAENDVFITKARAASKELIKLAQDYGYEF